MLRPPSHPSQWRLLAMLLVAIACACVSARARAGGGPENVLLVVNANSDSSMTIANHYVRLRDLPATNVVYVDYRGDKENITGAKLRDKVLAPVFRAITERRLGAQIDCVAYSSDLPWRVEFSREMPEGLKLPRQQKPIGSLTGVTYLSRHLLAKSPTIVSLDSNWYVPGPVRVNLANCTRLGAEPSRALRSRYLWGLDGSRVTDPKHGRRYILSTMLGVTTGRGNSVEEVVESLRRAIAAEVSPPDGAYYFMRGERVRTRPRSACFGEAAGLLRGLGARVVEAEGVLPRGASDVLGLMTGSPKLDLAGTPVGFRPGAIAEHLTSTGGNLMLRGQQTPISELIRAGATGACGTVIEPFAIQAKFPLPSLHVHYRRGCSLAEAFYQSVASPYQLLILGDPLCQPWADRPAIRVEGLPQPAEFPASDEPFVVQRVLDLKAVVTPAGAPPDDAPPEGLAESESRAPWELFIDGRLRGRLRSGATVRIDPSGLPPGLHELRCVGYSPDPIETSARRVAWVDLPEPAAAADEAADDTAEGAAAPARRAAPIEIEPAALIVPFEGEVRVTLRAPGAEAIVLRQNHREVARVSGESGVATAPASKLGHGPIRLQAVAEPSGSQSRPLWINVQ
ncbi:hypothetical protein Mal64_25050 [Pseudobythopirellula maris]|uniref:TIGR03790 family protein n=1 Tax=Pseudobythopirellula maris TaxID=2527991 RepID=A0A5C5ZNC3_9BACT|nr:TIGR03790 family protein [Pseudobythopirellula maris]TWT89014.1 hypothetical protein Mal64_25050 [Pseudobythopirellula maris]